MKWLQVLNLDNDFVLTFDTLSAVMSLLITFITLLVIIYSYSYLYEDPFLVKFLSYLGFFCFTMLLLVNAGNYIQLFLGWEGVGLASFLLISFWHSRNEANQGGLKAIIVNRIGDVFFLLALAIMWVMFNSFDFNIIYLNYKSIISETSIVVSNDNISMLAISMLPYCLFIAALAKSAQLVLHVG